MMTFRKPHDVHVRRFSRNLGLGLVLAAFVALVFGLTIAKVGTDTPEPTVTPAKTAQAQDASQ